MYPQMIEEQTERLLVMLMLMQDRTGQDTARGLSSLRSHVSHSVSVYIVRLGLPKTEQAQQSETACERVTWHEAYAGPNGMNDKSEPCVCVCRWACNGNKGAAQQAASRRGVSLCSTLLRAMASRSLPAKMPALGLHGGAHCSESEAHRGR